MGLMLLDEEGHEALKTLTQQAAEIATTTRTLSTGGETQFRDLQLRVRRVNENDPKDEYDDSVELIVRSPKQSAEVTLNEFMSTYFDDYEIIAQEIKPSGGRGEGRVKLQIRCVPQTPEPAKPRKAVVQLDPNTPASAAQGWLDMLTRLFGEDGVRIGTKDPSGREEGIFIDQNGIRIGQGGPEGWEGLVISPEAAGRFMNQMLQLQKLADEMGRRPHEGPPWPPGHEGPPWPPGFAAPDASPQSGMQRRIADLERQTRDLAEQIRRNPAMPDRERIANEIAKRLQEAFNLKEAMRERQAQEIERELERIRSLLQKRRENRERIIERRLHELIGGEEALEW
ncbi:MAG TPA: hypothetical protein VM492_11150 [Sumerlaeia bacterium]|nr:hypothetical protein [Sumerlaeia bacterium]